MLIETFKWIIITIIAFYFGIRTIKEAREAVNKAGRGKVSFKLKNGCSGMEAVARIRWLVHGGFEVRLAGEILLVDGLRKIFEAAFKVSKIPVQTWPAHHDYPDHLR
jgi:hypothetical protein